MTWTIAAATAAACLVAAAPVQEARPATSPSARALIRQASEAAYNLDYPEAHAAARHAAELDSDSSAAHRIVAWVAWNHILFLRGAVTIDYYIGGVTKSLRSLPAPPPDLESEFHREIARAIAIADAEVRANRKDVTAQFDLGAAYGLEASYAASVDAKVGAAFGAARHAFEADDTVLALAPSRIEAGVIVGTYRYIVASFSLPLRLFAYMAGFGGGKERGIDLIETAEHQSETPEDAEFALMLIYTREGRDGDVLTVLRNLERRFPRDRLLVLEEGATLLRGQQAAEADAVLTAGLARLAQETRPLAFGERAMWLYKRGSARVAAGRQDAATDLTEALSAGPVGWVNGRIHLELGKLADVRMDRVGALREYKLADATCRDNGDALCQSEADRLTKRPFALRASAAGGEF